MLGAGALAWAFWLGSPFGVIAAAYLALQVMYSGPLKHIVIIDVLTIAVGFALRAAAGAAVIAVAFSEWLLIMTILGALFLALSKRRHELVLLADTAKGHRRILEEYSPYLLDQMISVVTASTVVAYAIYTVSPDTIAKFQHEQAGPDAAVPALRDIPLPLSCASERRRRQPVGAPPERPPDARLHRPLGRDGGHHYLWGAGAAPEGVLVTRAHMQRLHG